MGQRTVCYYRNRSDCIPALILHFGPAGCGMHSLLTEPPSPPRVWMETGHFRNHSIYARSHHNSNSSESVHRAHQQLSQSTRPSRPRMEAVGAGSAIVGLAGLAIPVFKCAKELRDRIKLVRYPLHYLCTLRELIIMSAGRIGETGTLGSAHRIRKGYQPARVAL